MVALATLLAERTGDRSLALPTPTGKWLAGAAAFANGQQLWEEYQFLGARDAFALAGRFLGRTGLGLWAQAYHAALLNQTGDSLGSLRTIEETLSQTSAATTPLLRARCLWLRGILKGRLADFAGALLDYVKAEELYGAAGDTEHRAYIRSLQAEIHDLMGDPETAWDKRALAFEDAELLHDPRRRVGPYLLGIGSAIDNGWPNLARVLIEEIRPVVDRDAALPDQPNLLLADARVAFALGEPEAWQKLERAGSVTTQLPDPAARRRVLQEVEAVAAINAKDPVEREALLTRLIQERQQGGNSATLGTLLLARARARRTNNQPWEAEQDLRAGIGHLRDRVRATKDGRIRVNDQSYQLFEELAALQLQRGDPEEALLDTISLARAQYLDPSASVASQSLTARDSLVIVYGSIGDAMFAWTVSDASPLPRVSQHPLPLGAADLRRAVAELSAAIAGGRGGSEVAVQERHLYNALIAPLRGRLAGKRRVILSLDTAFALVPFPALRNPLSNRYLVEEFEIAQIPALTALQPSSADWDHNAAVSVVVSAPAGFPQLTSAVKEASLLRQNFPAATVLADPSRESLREAIAGVGVFHFSGHAVANAVYPRLSRLVMSVPSEDLTFAEVERISPPPELVVLAACRTNERSTYVGRGLLSLATPWLVAGTRTVVGNIWDVDDFQSALFFQSYYRHLKAATPAAALRLAQLDRIRAGTLESSERAWAGWVAVQRTPE
jgi:CHAT domain-containing protein